MQNLQKKICQNKLEKSVLGQMLHLYICDRAPSHIKDALVSNNSARCRLVNGYTRYIE